MQRAKKPKYHFWVKGTPKSFQKKGSLHRYKVNIRQKAKEIIEKPICSNRIDIEIYFKARVSLRADVDNILKPNLDALKGILYDDDKQVSSVKATAFPSDEAYGIFGPISEESLVRLRDSVGKEFLILIYTGLITSGPDMI